LVASLSAMQTLQVHVPGAFVGILSPAAPQLNPPDGTTGSLGSSGAVVEPEARVALGRGSSQEAHFILAASLSTMQTLQVHVPGAFVGSLRPAAAQLNPPPDGTTAGLGSCCCCSGPVVEAAGAALGRGSSQEAHFVLVASLSTMQTLQAHVPGAFVSTLSPAAPQLNPPDGTTGGLGSADPAVEAGAESGRGSSQEAHLVLVPSLSTMQTLHDHVPGAFVGTLSPATVQLKPPVNAAGLGGSGTIEATVDVPFEAASGRGSSHETHLVLAASLLTMHTPHVHEPAAFTEGFTPAASQLKPVEADFAPNVNVNVGREDDSVAKAALRSLACFKGYGGRAGTLKENGGRDAVSMRRAACFGSLDFIESGLVLGPASGIGLGAATLGAKGVGRLGIAGGFDSNRDVTGAGS